MDYESIAVGWLVFWLLFCGGVVVLYLIITLFMMWDASKDEKRIAESIRVKDK